MPVTANDFFLTPLSQADSSGKCDGSVTQAVTFCELFVMSHDYSEQWLAY